MSNFKLGELFENKAIEDFGSALRKALRENDDYASLMELEYVETPGEFAETIKKFLRRYETYAKREMRRRPSDVSLDEIMKLVDNHGVRAVRAALVSHALTRAERVAEK